MSGSSENMILLPSSSTMLHLYRRSEELPSVLFSPTESRSRAISVYRDRVASVSRSELKWSYKPLSTRRQSEGGKSESPYSKSNNSWRKSMIPSILSARISEFLQKTNHVDERWKRSTSCSSDAYLKNHHHTTNKYYSRGSSAFDTRDDCCSSSQLLYRNELNEIAIDLAEERSCATLASNHLELETAERIRLEKEVHEMQKEKRQLMENSESLEMELLCSRSGQLNGPSGDEVEDGAYKERYKQAIRELEFTRRRLQQQHQDDLEQLVGLKKQLEKKLADAYEEVEEQRQVVAQWKRKAQKLSAETNDLRLLLEEQNSRNNLLEKKQRKFDAEFQLLTDELRQEKANKERSCRDKELILGDKYALEQNINSLKLELELKDQKLLNLTQEHEELMFGGNTEEDVAQLKKVKHQLESKVKDQEEELDDLAGQVQLLEQAKLRLEMSIEQMRKEHRRELQQRDEEIEEVRCNAYKKAKSLECQLESEHEERTGLLRERHELERRLAEAEERLRSNNTSNQDLLHKLRRDLKRTKVLLRDAQMTIEQTRGEGSNKAVVRQLRNQVEDAECARAAAVKGRQTAEAEAAEAVASMEEATRARTELEERLVAVTRDRAQIQSQLDENEEELAEVLKKYRAAVQQLSTEQAAQQEQASHVAQLESERASLREQLAELNSRLENMETLSDPSSSLTAKMLQIKNKELESKLDLEQTTRSRLEIQIARLRETTERLQADITASRVRENSAHEATRKMSRSLREAKEEQQLLMVREADYNSKCQELEKKLETSEAETAAAKFDLRLAMQRIEDLQCALEGDMEDANVVGSDSDLESGGSSDDSLGTYLANHNVHSSSNSHGSLDSYQSAERSLSEMQVKRINEIITKDSSCA